MAKFEDTVAKAKEYLDIAGKKTGEFIDLQKLKINASTVRNSIAKDFESVGRMYYDGLKKETDNSDAIRLSSRISTASTRSWRRSRARLPTQRAATSAPTAVLRTPTTHTIADAAEKSCKKPVFR